jgi:hypothetical protein
MTNLSIKYANDDEHLAKLNLVVDLREECAPKIGLEGLGTSFVEADFLGLVEHASVFRPSPLSIARMREQMSKRTRGYGSKRRNGNWARNDSPPTGRLQSSAVSESRQRCSHPVPCRDTLYGTTISECLWSTHIPAIRPPTALMLRCDLHWFWPAYRLARSYGGI